MSEASTAVDSVVNDMVRAIVADVSPQMIVLFGSRGRGEGREGSDVDLLVVEDGPFNHQRSRRLEAARLYRRLAGTGIAKDILVVSRAEVDKWRDSLNHVIARALREGRVVYERP